MGIAVAGGIMASLESSQSSSSTSDVDSLPPRLPTRFNACVRTHSSRVEKELGHYKAPLTVYKNDNVSAVRDSDIVLLGCKPWMLSDILGQEGMVDALKGKLLISILAGVSVEQIERTLYPSNGGGRGEILRRGGCTVVRAMPNTASAVREGMTVIATTDPPLADDQLAIVKWMFSQIGLVSVLESKLMDVSTALCGSAPAFVALVIEALADGAVAMGMPRQEASMMAAQAARGTTGLVLKGGEHPAVLREKVSTPGGCTIGGLLVLEEGAVRGSVSRAVREATVVASQLGKGVQGVNGTRPPPM